MNGMCLCHAHHRYFTLHPDEWYRFCESVRPGVWELLAREMCTTKKLNNIYEEWIEHYTRALPRSERGEP